jgi:hypothetical protein
MSAERAERDGEPGEYRAESEEEAVGRHGQ